MNKLELDAILAECRFRDWTFALVPIGDGYFVRVRDVQEYLSPSMNGAQVLERVWRAVQTAVEHEARDLFTYRGTPIYALPVPGTVTSRFAPPVSDG
jgi:hypothetical protein